MSQASTVSLVFFPLNLGQEFCFWSRVRHGDGGPFLVLSLIFTWLSETSVLQFRLVSPLFDVVPGVLVVTQDAQSTQRVCEASLGDAASVGRATGLWWRLRWTLRVHSATSGWWLSHGLHTRRTPRFSPFSRAWGLARVGVRFCVGEPRTWHHLHHGFPHLTWWMWWCTVARGMTLLSVVSLVPKTRRFTVLWCPRASETVIVRWIQSSSTN